MPDYESAYSWTISDVAEWLVGNNFDNYVNLFTVEHGIDGRALMMLTEDDLRSPPLSLRVLGDIKHLMLCLGELKSRPDVSPVSRLSNGASGCSSKRAVKPRTISNCSEEYQSQDYLDHHSPVGKSTSEGSNYALQISKNLKPEFQKLLISYFYMFIVFMLTAFVMVIVHDRVPDMDKYPPLPDIMLDNLPYIPWAFEACEATAVVLMLILSITLFFHKHRFIILRRLFALTGTVFMLRCVTMLITSLSVPGTHLQCEPKTMGNIRSKIERALVIWSGFGMSLQGVRTCGDYMFSGHTVVVTLLNFFITEYTPRGIPMLHTISWIMNIFAIFFILAAHEHYSIDVFVAFYITSRLFLYYHSLANNRVLRQPDCTRTRIWFPLFSYFESSIDGIVPNEYEWPHSAILRYVQHRRAGKIS